MTAPFTFAFSDYKSTVKALGKDNLKTILGTKGANIAEITAAGLPVPNGFTISADVCRSYYKQDPPAFADGFWEEVTAAVSKIEEETEKKFGAGEKPLFLSARYSSEEALQKSCLSVLNIGFNDAAVAAFVAAENGKWAWTEYLKYIYAYSSVILKVDAEKFAEVISAIKTEKNVSSEFDLEIEDMEAFVGSVKGVLETEGTPFPQDAMEQLKAAVTVVIESWNSEAALTFRQENSISNESGIAVVVMMQVFGNMNEMSGTGLYFSRNPSSGENALMGTWSANAQGPEFISKAKPPQPIASIDGVIQGASDKIADVNRKLEKYFKDFQKVDFTIENGEIYVLQSRNSRRTPIAAIKINAELANDGTMTKEDAVQKTTTADVEVLLNSLFKPDDLKASEEKKFTSGSSALPGAVCGKICLSSAKAVEMAGQDIILVLDSVGPMDIAGVLSAKGLITRCGGSTSYSSVMAKQAGVVAIVGCDIVIDNEAGTVTVGETVARDGEVLSLDGVTGVVYTGPIPIIKGRPEENAELEQILTWADELRKTEHGLQVYGNADTEKDVKRAKSFGCEGIGLCRIDPMLYGERTELVRKIILCPDEGLRDKLILSLAESLGGELVNVFEAFGTTPAVVRLVDPPIATFLPEPFALAEEAATDRVRRANAPPPEEAPPAEEAPAEATPAEGEAAAESTDAPPAESESAEEGEDGAPKEPEPEPIIEDTPEQVFEKVKPWLAKHPEFGVRGARLSLCVPGILKAQIRAIMAGISGAIEKGATPAIEVLIPFVTCAEEVTKIISEVKAITKAVSAEREGAAPPPIKLAAMIEVPNAAFVADKIAKHVETLTFGTNDLNQAMFGYSRETAEKEFLRQYCETGIYTESPFQTIDVDGVGQLIELAVQGAKKGNEDIVLGVCGELAGDPKSIDFFYKAGFTYVSCCATKVPIARLAAAHAILAGRKPDEEEPEDDVRPQEETESTIKGDESTELDTEMDDE